LTVTPDGTVARIADLSDPHDIPTGIALAPDGGVYVGYLTQFPYSDGTSYVDRIGPDGTRTKVWTGLTGVTALTVGPDGVLYAAEISTNNTQETVGQPGTGRIVRQTGPDSLEPVVTGLNGPVGVDFGPDGALYVSSPAIGAENGTGVVHRIALAA
jgi:glucose/arabinose dehydrogenase